jgi:hypothetical protein
MAAESIKRKRRLVLTYLGDERCSVRLKADTMMAVGLPDGSAVGARRALRSRKVSEAIHRREFVLRDPCCTE